MKNRIWFAIYWTAVTYSLLTVLVLIVSFTSWKDTPIEKEPARNTLKISKNLNQKLLFNFIEYRMEDCYFYSRPPFGYLTSLDYDRQSKCRADKVSSSSI